MLTCVPVTRSLGAGDKTIHPFTGDQTWPVPDPLLLTMTIAALNWPQPPADTPTLAYPTLLLLKSKSEFVEAQSLYWMAGRELRDPLAVAFLSADTVFVLPVFLSLSNSVLHSIHFLFFSPSSRLYFLGKDKKKLNKEDQALDRITLRHSEEWIACCVHFSSFQL